MDGSEPDIPLMSRSQAFIRRSRILFVVLTTGVFATAGIAVAYLSDGLYVAALIVAWGGVFALTLAAFTGVFIGPEVSARQFRHEIVTAVAYAGPLHGWDPEMMSETVEGWVRARVPHDRKLKLIACGASPSAARSREWRQLTNEQLDAMAVLTRG